MKIENKEEFIYNLLIRLNSLFDNIMVDVHLEDLSKKYYVRIKYCFLEFIDEEKIENTYYIDIDSTGLFTQEAFFDYIVSIFKDKVIKNILYDILGARYEIRIN